MLASSLFNMNFFWKSMLRSSFMCSEKRCSGLRTKKEQRGILLPAEQGQMCERKRKLQRLNRSFLAHPKTRTERTLTFVCCPFCLWWPPSPSGPHCGPCQSRLPHGAAACDDRRSSVGISCTGYWRWGKTKSSIIKLHTKKNHTKKQENNLWKNVKTRGCLDWTEDLLPVVKYKKIMLKSCV